MTEIKLKIEFPDGFVEALQALVKGRNQANGEEEEETEEEEEVKTKSVPKKKVPGKQPAKTEEPEEEEEEETEEEEANPESIRELATGIASQSEELKAKVKSIIKKQGKADTLKDIKPASYQKVFDALTALKEEAEL